MSNTSTFSFAAGNAQKILTLPVYGLGKLASLIVPRDPKRWVFGCGAGIGEGALPLYRQVQRTLPDARLTWIVSSDTQQRDAEAAGLHWVRRGSWRGFWQTLRASTIVVTHGFGDVNRFAVFGAFVVQLWHGIPLKKLHLDTEVTLTTRRGLGGLLRRMYRSGGKSISMFVAASEMVGARLQTAFGLRDGVIAPIGDPRDDALIASNSQDSRAAVLRALGVSDDGARLVLYAPTWRDGMSDPAVPNAEEWAAIEQWAQRHDVRLIVRAHPLGVGSYERKGAQRVHLLGTQQVGDVTPLLAAFDLVVTDYSSIAFDYSLLGKPIVWFAPDLEQYERDRGFYEPYESVTEGVFARTWPEALEHLTEALSKGGAAASAERSTRLASRLFAHSDGKSAQRVLDEVLGRRSERMRSVDRAAVRSASRDAAISTGPEPTTSTVFFESFYGRQVSCNPLALDAEIARVAPNITRYWSVADASMEVPEGAQAIVSGTPEWRQARSNADLLIINDWLRKDFVPGSHQRVLQTWHGTMLKKLALERSGVSLRTRFATMRESRKWDVLLSQNTHSTVHLRKSYAYRGPIWQVGYPRDDELVRLDRETAKKRLGISADMHVLAYAPTWRDASKTVVDLLDVVKFAKRLPDNWMLLVRGHTRTHEFGNYPELSDRLRDVSRWPNVNDVLAASDLFVTDYSSLMFDASVARIPMAFYAPDLERYRDEERGFTFDFDATAPGPIVRDRAALLKLVETLPEWTADYASRYDAWRQRFNPHDDGNAAKRVVERLFLDGYISAGH